jgi:hypothetical protein
MDHLFIYGHYILKTLTIKLSVVVNVEVIIALSRKLPINTQEKKDKNDKS